MRVRCRFGIHEWEHVGYTVRIDSDGILGWKCRQWRRCESCGKRRAGRWIDGVPPEVEMLDGGKRYIDHSKVK